MGSLTEASDAIGNNTFGFPEVLFKTARKPQDAAPVNPGVACCSVSLVSMRGQPGTVGGGFVDLCSGVP